MCGVDRDVGMMNEDCLKVEHSGENMLWRVVNAVASVLVLVAGFCSYEAHELVQTVAHVSDLNAMVPYSLMWSVGMATLVALYVYRKTMGDVKDAAWAGNRALTLWLVSAMAFMPLPLAMMLMMDSGAPGASILYTGYFLKAVCFLHLYWLFFRYHVLDDPHALSYGWSVFHGRRHAPQPSSSDTGSGAEVKDEGEPDIEDPVAVAGETDETPEPG